MHLYNALNIPKDVQHQDFLFGEGCYEVIASCPSGHCVGMDCSCSASALRMLHGEKLAVRCM